MAAEGPNARPRGPPSTARPAVHRAARLAQGPLRVGVQALQSRRHVRSAEAQAEVVARVLEDRAWQNEDSSLTDEILREPVDRQVGDEAGEADAAASRRTCLLYTSDAADDLLCVDLGG